MQQAGRIRDRFHFVLACVGLAALALGLRVCGAANDLWLDEVWSLKLIGGISSPWQVFTRIHLDNNHYLNGLWLWFLGTHASPIAYRLPSIVAGAGAVVMAGMIGRRRNVMAGYFALVLTAFSYVLILYSSEARGYAMAVFFSFLCFYAMDSYLSQPRWATAFLYAASAVLGLASHLVFVSVLLAGIVWSYAQLRSTRFARPMLACHAFPLLFLVWLYEVDIRRMAEGGGTFGATLLATYGAALSWSFGISVVVSLLFLSAGFWLVSKDPGRSWIFFLGVVVVFPILLAILRNAAVIYVRYFTISMAFLLLLGSFLLAALWQRGRAGRNTCRMFLALYFVMNGLHLAGLFHHGRGHYGDAIKYMSEHSRSPVITIDSDNDFQVPLLLEYYGHGPGLKPFEYRLKKSGPWGAEWLVLQKDSLDTPVPPFARDVESGGFQYELVATYPTAPLSGLHWFLYQRRA